MRTLLAKGLHAGVLMMALTLASLAQAASVGVQVRPEIQSELRGIDYTVGDIAQQTITINLPLGFRLDHSTLPKVGSRSVIDIRSVRAIYEDLRDTTRYKIVIDWQVFMALREIRAVPLLDLDFQFLREGKVLPVHIRAAEVIISPLLPTKMDKLHLIPQPDIEPVTIAIKPYIEVFLAGLSGLLLAALYIAWHLGWIDIKTDAALPFRQAWLAIRKSRKQVDKSADARHSLILLSRAFDEYAQAVVSPENLATLFARYPGLKTHESDIRQFYADAQRVFFAGDKPAHSVEQIESLARELSRQQAA